MELKKKKKTVKSIQTFQTIMLKFVINALYNIISNFDLHNDLKLPLVKKLLETILFETKLPYKLV